MRSSGYRAAPLVLIACAVVLAYLPGLPGPFVFDDMRNIVDNPALAVTALDASSLIAAMGSGPGGGIGRPLAMLTFGLNYYFAGGVAAPISFKATNLAIHLINAALVYWLANMLGKRAFATKRAIARWLPALATLLWALHPIQLTSVLYTVQRMTSLSALFVLAGLLLFVHGREQLESSLSRAITWMSGGIALGLVLGFLAKENSILTVFYALAIEYAFFDRSQLAKSQRRALMALYGVTAALPIFFGALWLLLHPDILLAGYVGRDFTPVQRLFTEARALWFYAGLLLYPIPARFSLFHDDFAFSTGIVSPWPTLPAVLALVAAAAVAITCRRRAPMLSFAVLWFLGGHILESGVVALELVHEHRNYLPSFGPLFALAGAICHVSGRIQHRSIAFIAGAGLALVVGLATSIRAATWSSEESLIEAMVRQHPRSSRAHAMYAELAATRWGDINSAVQHYERAIELAPQEPAFALRLALLIASSFVPENAAPANKQNVPSPLYHGVLTDGITAQLTSRSVTADTLLALEAMRRCIAENIGSCAHLLSDVVAWHQAILRNERTGPAVKIPLLFALFELAYSKGRYEIALAAAEQGNALARGSTDFLLMQADALVALNRLEDAERTLAQIDANPRTAEERRESLDIIRRKIRDLQRRPNSPSKIPS